MLIYNWKDWSSSGYKKFFWTKCFTSICLFVSSHVHIEEKSRRFTRDKGLVMAMRLDQTQLVTKKCQTCQEMEPWLRGKRFTTFTSKTFQMQHFVVMYRQQFLVFILAGGVHNLHTKGCYVKLSQSVSLFHNECITVVLLIIFTQKTINNYFWGYVT